MVGHAAIPRAERHGSGCAVAHGRGSRSVHLRARVQRFNLAPFLEQRERNRSKGCWACRRPRRQTCRHGSPPRSTSLAAPSEVKISVHGDPTDGDALAGHAKLRTVSSPEERREIRLATWTGGVAHSFVEMDAIDFEFWLAMAPAERLKMVWSLVEDGLALQGNHGSTPRLQRLVGGVRPLRG